MSMGELLGPYWHLLVASRGALERTPGFEVRRSSVFGKQLFTFVRNLLECPGGVVPIGSSLGSWSLLDRL